MPIQVRIDCVNKSDRFSPWERITHVGGPDGEGGRRWRMSQQEAIAGIERGDWAFYVERPPGDGVWVVVATSQYGNKYIKTARDGDQPNNLLSLPECPNA